MSHGIAEIAFLIRVFRLSSPLTGVRNTALDITQHEKIQWCCLTNVEAKALDRLCRYIFLELSRLGTRVPADPNEVEHHLVAE
jgi:hypothetical protein